MKNSLTNSIFAIFTNFIIINFLFCNFVSANTENHNPEIISTNALHPKQLKWSFDGIFGTIDRQSAQRGFQIYKEVCSSCHGLKLASYRNLAEIGFTEAEIKQIASEYQITDGPNEDGDMFERQALASDKFASPYPNDNSARSANGGALPPDLSLIVKARHDGANYIYSILTSYEDAPDNFPLTQGKYYNSYFEGRQISMPAPITDDNQIEYKDLTFASKEQMAVDIVNFLQFISEPEMEHRKKMGIRTMIFLSILFILMLIAKKIVWKQVK